MSDDIKKQVEERVKAEQQEVKKETSIKEKLTSKYIRECLNANEFGDGSIYSEIHQGQYLYNKTAGEWLSWTGHHWQRDIMDDSLAAVESVSKVYIDEAMNIAKRIGELSGDKNEEKKVNTLIKTQEAIYKRISRLRTERGRVNCLKFAHTNPVNHLSVEGEEFDQLHWLLACLNGVVDLKTGEISDGRSGDLISKASPIEWKGIDEPALEWERFLNQIFKGNGDIVEYMGRLFGYGITGLTREHILPILWGKGRNGKGTMIEIIKYVLGPLAAPIRSEMLLDQGRTSSSSGPTSDIMSLRGLRIAFASESDEGRRFSPSKVKWLSGGDTLVGRAPHDKYETYFSPTHKLVLMTNELPHAPSYDFAFWERVHLVPFELSFVDRKPQTDDELPADKELPERLQQEASGILAWLVRGCLAWQEKGIAPPPVITEATAKFRRDEDTLADFIDECCFLKKGEETKSADLYTAFKDWYQTNVYKKNAPSQKKFGKMMVKKFHREKHGTYFYYGVGLLDQEFGQSENEPIPDY